MSSRIHQGGNCCQGIFSGYANNVVRETGKREDIRTLYFLPCEVLEICLFERLNHFGLDIEP